MPRVRCIDGPLDGQRRERPPLAAGVDEHEELVPASRKAQWRARCAACPPPRPRVATYRLERRRVGHGRAFDVLRFVGFRELA